MKTEYKIGDAVLFRGRTAGELFLGRITALRYDSNGFSYELDSYNIHAYTINPPKISNKDAIYGLINDKVAQLNAFTDILLTNFNTRVKDFMKDEIMVKMLKSIEIYNERVNV